MLTRILTFLCFILLVGCVQVPLKKPEVEQQTVQPPPNPTRQAEAFEYQANYTEAAREYLRLAYKTNPPTRQSYQLSAIRSYLKGGYVEEAKAEWARFNLQQSFGLQVPLQLVYAQFSIADQRIDQAFNYLKVVGNPQTLPPKLQTDYYEVYSKILERQRHYLDAAKQRILLDTLLPTNSTASNKNQQSLWDNLQRLSPTELNSVPQTAGDVLAGWTSLARIAKTVRPKVIQQVITDWQRQFPRHPANNSFVPKLVQSILTLPPRPKEIALLLPLSSRFKVQAEVVRDGFLAAYYELGNQDKPNVTVHDVGQGNAAEVYNKVVYEGADFVVGPLQKDNINKIIQNQTAMPVPTLLLNYAPQTVNINNLYQFGLSPENEAQEVADKAWADGHRTALVLVPQNSWGSRVLQAFQTAWQQRGGQIALTQTYTQDVSQAVSFIANNQVSADMTFIAAYPKFARLIQPFFKRYHNTNAPIYSTSHTYSGTPDPQMDIDLEGTIFGDMPWVLSPDEQGRRLQQTLIESFPDKLLQFKRLFALGIDAFSLMTHLQHFNLQPYALWQGQTGQLFVDNQQRIWRKLMWAYFQQGKVQLLNGSDAWDITMPHPDDIQKLEPEITGEIIENTTGDAVALPVENTETVQTTITNDTLKTLSNAQAQAVETVENVIPEVQSATTNSIDTVNANVQKTEITQTISNQTGATVEDTLSEAEANAVNKVRLLRQPAVSE
ncbi:penicillin-binding protein activator [Candidatus Albibeggiatoa sp. nov. NOAA]|uniref:penicillin-binding protein activator n=1 Tax=Candidatus Albibeggiatoa sp. nov. NOAA TaxID=3162724 RepID=UPI0032F250D2|nr:penicillin-binding protein activator [Thiotrichaceae bacterium]